MFHKIREAQQGEREEGFTLIELLVVVIIIGILAAIAIPVFLNQREKARNSAANSDLRNLITAEEGYYTENDKYTTDTADNGDLADNGFTKSSSVVHCVDLLAPSGGGQADQRFQAEAYHPDGTLYFYYDSEDGTIEKQDSTWGVGC